MSLDGLYEVPKLLLSHQLKTLPSSADRLVIVYENTIYNLYESGINFF